MVEDSEKEKYICMNHEPYGWVFRTKKEDPECPLCKLKDYVCCYSGDREPTRKGGDKSGKKKEKKEQTQMSIMP